MGQPEHEGDKEKDDGVGGIDAHDLLAEIASDLWRGRTGEQRRYERRVEQEPGSTKKRVSP
jgi:hypothetical protein